MKWFLAPLAGFTNAPFRRLCAHWGADLTYTEMVSAAGLAHGSSPTHQLLETFPDEGPVACQLFGANPSELAIAAAEVEKVKSRFVAIDLNAGCPMRKIVQEGCGAALVNDPQLIGDCLRAMRAATSLPITLKTRPGPRPDDIRLFEILAAAEEAGVSRITLHARFTSQMHGGATHLDLLAALVARAKIPITGNGGVYNALSAKAMAETGVDAIMIARASLANPWIFSDLKNNISDEEAKAPELRLKRQKSVFQEHLKSLLAFREQLVAHYPNDAIPSVDGFISVALHTQLFRYFNGQPGAAELRRKLNSMRTLEEVQALIPGPPAQ